MTEKRQWHYRIGTLFWHILVFLSMVTPHNRYTLYVIFVLGAIRFIPFPRASNSSLTHLPIIQIGLKMGHRLWMIFLCHKATEHLNHTQIASHGWNGNLEMRDWTLQICLQSIEFFLYVWYKYSPQQLPPCLRFHTTHRLHATHPPPSLPSPAIWWCKHWKPHHAQNSLLPSSW